MKKKKLPLWGVLLLVALYLFFGLGNDIPEAADPVMPVETTALQTLPPDCAEALLNMRQLLLLSISLIRL